MIFNSLKFGLLLSLGVFAFSCSSNNGLGSIFAGNPARTVEVAIKDGDAKQLRNAWDNKALSLCKSGYEITNLGKIVSTAGGHNSLSGSISCK